MSVIIAHKEMLVKYHVLSLVIQGRCGKTISKSGREWTLPAQLGRLKTGQDGKGLLQTHLWCTDEHSRS